MAANKHRESWRLIKRITGKNAAKGEMIKGKTKEYNIDTVFEDLGINHGNFTNEKLEIAKLKIKEGKQTGSEIDPN